MTVRYTLKPRWLLMMRMLMVMRMIMKMMLIVNIVKLMMMMMMMMLKVSRCSPTSDGTTEPSLLVADLADIAYLYHVAGGRWHSVEISKFFLTRTTSLTASPVRDWDCIASPPGAEATMLMGPPRGTGKLNGTEHSDS